jgi:hypothetical protein
MLRRDLEVPGAPQVSGYGFAKREDADWGDVAVATCCHGGAQGVDNRGGRMEVRLTEFEVDDGAALLF